MEPIWISLVLLGYTFFCYTSSDKTGGENKFDLMINRIFDCEITTSLRFDCGTILIHFHHWLLCFIGYIFFFFLNLKELSYFMLGGVIQGIVNYNDWKDIILFKQLE